MNWKVYNELAWVDEILSDSASYEREITVYVQEIFQHVPDSVPTMLHFGCGAGNHDFHFKQYFVVTGVDISKGSLEIAKKTNPEINYVHGDMRSIELHKTFDVVIIPDSIMYMTTIEDLAKTIKNAKKHLNPKGVVLIVVHTKEEYQNNNFVYTASKEKLHITVLENNHKVSDSSYEATIIYLIHQEGQSSIHHEVHTLGLFTHKQWLEIFYDNNFFVNEKRLDDLYDDYFIEEGEYQLTLFVLKHKP